MADRTGISWTDATWNPIRGCSRVSEGCRNCYAETQAARIVRMGNGKPTPYDGLVRLARIPASSAGATGGAEEPRWVESPGGRAFAFGVEARWTGKVVLDPAALAKPLRWRRPRRIFVNSMSDLFHERLSNEQIAAVFGVMAAARQHTFQVLTKRARRMRAWFEWIQSEPELGASPLDMCCEELADLDIDFDLMRVGDSVSKIWPLPNVWLGVSTEDQETYVERVRDLHFVPAAVHFISAEPLLGAINMRADELNPAWLDWVIAGCESGPGARPCDAAWLRSLRDQCDVAGVAFFLKQAVGDDSEPAYEDDWERDHRTHGLAIGTGSKRKAGGVIELPYLDGVQHAAFPGGAA
jgi:protein gp37